MPKDAKNTLRIIGGKLRGQRFRALADESLRPTRDRVREAIASALQARHAIIDARVLDLFAGNGAYGFEMLSWGAKHALFVDNDAKVLSHIRQVAAELNLASQTHTQPADLLARPKSAALTLSSSPHAPFSLVFVDPPYAETANSVVLLQELAMQGALANDAWLIIEHATDSPPELGEPFDIEKRFRYGTTSIILAQLPANPTEHTS